LTEETIAQVQRPDLIPEMYPIGLDGGIAGVENGRIIVEKSYLTNSMGFSNIESLPRKTYEQSIKSGFNRKFPTAFRRPSISVNRQLPIILSHSRIFAVRFRFCMS
jgi:hypothetical protein